MSTRLTRTSLFVAALLALFINASVLAQNGPGGMFSGRITGLTNSGSDVGAANGLSTAVGFAPAVESCKKVGPVLPSHVFVFEEPQVCLVDQGRSLQSIAGALAAHVVAGEASQLIVHKGDELIECGLVAVPPIFEKPGNRFRLRGHLAPLPRLGRKTTAGLYHRQPKHCG
jgi:hypothetical protein